MESSKELRDLTLRSYEAMARGDISFLEQLLSKEPGVLSLGTDPNEWWSGYSTIIEAFREQLQQTGSFPLQGGDPQAYSEGTVGWVVDRPTLRIPGAPEVKTRVTVIYHKENNAWKIVQMVFSASVPNEELFK
jgi:hypothetical protein